jgi:phosphohistidine phosphatase
MANALYLLRHLKSSWDEPGLADRDRPLAPRGRKAGKKLARHLRETGVAPELVLCSTSVRTRQTLDAVADGLGEPQIRFVDELYAASEEELLDVLRGLEPDIDSVMLIAHNPGLENLSAELTGVSQEKFPTGALATLSVPGAWNELEPSSCELTAFVVPRELG